MLLVIDRRETQLKLESNALVVSVDGVRQPTVPLALLSHLVIVRKTTLDSSLLAQLADHGVVISLQGGKFNHNHATVIGNTATLAKTRHAQYACALNPADCARVVRILLMAKTRRQCRFLHTLRNARADQRYALSKAINTLSNSIQQLRSTDDIDKLRGYEGANAAAYFRAFNKVFPEQLNFNRRERRPPPDPVNSVLSLGYTLLYNQATQAIHQAGLDPLCGFLHSPAHGRASLAADAVELFRCEVDKLVWQLFRDRHLRIEHFKTSEDGCLLGKTGRALVYQHLSHMRPRWHRELKLQARRLRRAMENNP